MIDFLVYDPELTAIGVVDTQSSILWERRFYEAGYFEMTVPASENNNTMFKCGRYIMRADAVESGIILRVQKSVNDEGDASITIIGRFLSYIMHGHIVRSSTIYSGNAETIMRELVSNTVMQVDNADYIPGLELGDLCGTDKTISIRIQYHDLYSALKEIARLAGVAFRIVLNPNSGKMTFECYEGRDFRANQYTNAQVVFSPEYDTIIGSAEYTEDNSGTVNAVTMVYSGEFGEVAVRYDPAGAVGTELHEISMITDQCVTGTSTGGITVLDVAGTRALLGNLAREYISAKEVYVSASAASSGGIGYKTDYDIGDIVTVEYKPFGVSLTQRIHKVMESYSESGKEIVPVFGDITPKEV